LLRLHLILVIAVNVRLIYVRTRKSDWIVKNVDIKFVKNVLLVKLIKNIV